MTHELCAELCVITSNLAILQGVTAPKGQMSLKSENNGPLFTWMPQAIDVIAVDIWKPLQTHFTTSWKGTTMCCPGNCFIATAELVSNSRGDYFLFMKMVNYSETLLLSKERNFMAISVATFHACTKCTKCPNVQMRVIVVWN